MNILGLCAFRNDSSAAMLVDGQVVAAAAEERFTRRKHDGAFPAGAIRYCLGEAGIGPEGLDHVAFFCDPWLAVLKRIPYILRNLPASLGWGSSSYRESTLQMLLLERELKKQLGDGFRAKVHGVEHHLCHLAYAYYGSPYEHAALASIDGAGELDTTLLARGNGDRIEVLHRTSLPHSLGYFYSAAAQYLGLRRHHYLNDDGEGKTMGLSSYGQPRYLETFSKMFLPAEPGTFRMDMDYFAYQLGEKTYFSEKFERELGPRRQPGEELTSHHHDVAATLQLVLEDRVLEMANHLHHRTGEDALCLAGGTALNCVMNGRLLREGPFKEVFVPPDAGDSGTALGACLKLHADLTGTAPRDPSARSAWLGPGFTREQCRSALEAAGVAYEEPEDPPAVAARMVADGKIVAWFEGRMEVGPRALGSRSIMADPRRPETKDQLNSRVKFREPFRPFAPSVPIEFAEEYFNLGGHASPYMLLAVPVHKEKQSEIPAVTHVDGTARVQTVHEELTPNYHRAHLEFKKATGVPVMVNTSFNIRGEPIINHPAQAVQCFKNTDIDALVIEGLLAVKGGLSGPDRGDGEQR